MPFVLAIAVPLLFAATTAPAPDPNAGNDTAAGTPKGPSAGMPVVKEPPQIDWADVPGDRVTVELCEEWKPEKNLWPDQPPAATETFTAPAFGFFRVPHKYVGGGVRAARNDPYLLRGFATLQFPPGTHRLLLRSRGAAALFVDDKPVAITPFPPPGTDDKPVKVQDRFLDLGGDFRFAPPGNRDAWCEFTSSGGEHRVVLETVVGYVIGPKSRRRPELGETVVAWSPANSTEWYLLAPGGARIDYDDAGWPRYAAGEEERLAAIDAAARARCRDSEAATWIRRRAAAESWLASTPETPVPPLAAGFPAFNPVDHFLAAKIAAHRAESAVPQQGVDFWARIHPLLEARCLGCHQGGEPKGGLHLDTRSGALAGGDGDGPAIVPGKPSDSPLLRRVTAADPDERMPPQGERLSAAETAALQAWIAAGAAWPEFRPTSTTLTPLTDDLTFLRRLTLDTIGLVPSLAEIAAFRADRSPTKRAAVVDRLLADPRAADHWTAYWQDVLAENPNILNPTLNNTGPFRWWIYESLLDHAPLDRMVSDLVMLGGSAKDGGPAGFGVASQNDVPLAAKATILTTAFLGVETKCSRCHDAPAHAAKQEQLFALAAMLDGKGITLPATSSVAMDKLAAGGRRPLIEVTLAPGTVVEPRWPFPQFVAPTVADELAAPPADSRSRLAALLTAPQNERFAQAMANRLWARVMGRGLVDKPWDWERSQVSHPELLRWLGRELVRSGYDADHVLRLILTSHAYQRANDPALAQTSPLFAAPAARRLTAEQIVDSAFAAVGKPFRTEEASLDIDSIRETANSLSLGQPRRAWMLTSTSNERDRPSLALPRMQAVCDVLTAFGWRASRPDPLTNRDTSANPLQPALLGNGTMGGWLTRLSDDHAITAMALETPSPEAFVETVFLRILTRSPRPEERARLVPLVAEGFAARVVAAPPPAVAGPRRPAYYVSWSNHLDADATRVRQAQEADARRGDPPTPRLRDDWRRRAEDVIWAAVNAPEFIFSP
jgi:mono/diheme cytochrome c family protein